MVSTWPAIRQGAQGLVAFSDTQARTQAWSLREIAEAAAANPDGSAEKAYFATILNNNINFLLSEAAAAHQGQSSGWIPSGGGSAGSSHGSRISSRQPLPWRPSRASPAQNNCCSGRRISLPDVFSLRLRVSIPTYGIAYYLEMFDPSVGQSSPYQTWAQIAQLTQATAGPPSPPGKWDGAYSAVRALHWPATSRSPHRRTRYTPMASSSRIRPVRGSPTSRSSPASISFRGCRMDSS